MANTKYEVQDRYREVNKVISFVGSYSVWQFNNRFNQRQRFNLEKWKRLGSSVQQTGLSSSKAQPLEANTLLYRRMFQSVLAKHKNSSLIKDLDRKLEQNKRGIDT